MLHKNLFYDRLEKESEPSIPEEQLKTCERCIHIREPGGISGSPCYLCSRNPVDHRIDCFEYDVDVAHLSTNDVNNINYKVCCPMCDNEKCVKGTDECELERWKAKRLRR